MVRPNDLPSRISSLMRFRRTPPNRSAVMPIPMIRPALPARSVYPICRPKTRMAYAAAPGHRATPRPTGPARGNYSNNFSQHNAEPTLPGRSGPARQHHCTRAGGTLLRLRRLRRTAAGERTSALASSPAIVAGELPLIWVLPPRTPPGSPRALTTWGPAQKAVWVPGLAAVKSPQTSTAAPLNFRLTTYWESADPARAGVGDVLTADDRRPGHVDGLAVLNRSPAQRRVVVISQRVVVTIGCAVTWAARYRVSGLVLWRCLYCWINSARLLRGSGLRGRQGAGAGAASGCSSRGCPAGAGTASRGFRRGGWGRVQRVGPRLRRTVPQAQPGRVAVLRERPAPRVRSGCSAKPAGAAGCPAGAASHRASRRVRPRPVAAPAGVTG